MPDIIKILEDTWIIAITVSLEASFPGKIKQKGGNN